MAGDPTLIIGLGNPGPEYERTRHNVGVMVVDELCDRLGARLRPLKGVRALSAEARDGDARIVLARPATYMNLSGEAVGPLARYYKVAPTDVVVVHDDLDLPLGSIRIKAGGSDAGHNGLASVTRTLKTRDYARVRIGIGRPPGRQDPADYVLRPFSRTDGADATLAIAKAADAALTIAREGLDAAQERHNERRQRAPKPPARAVRKQVRIRARPEDVFDAWTTEDGARTFFAPAAHIELRPGGAYEMLFAPGAPEGERGSEGCTVVAFERPRFLVFTWNAPPSIPTVRAARPTRVELRFEPDGDATLLGLTHSGWGKGADWDEALSYFDRAWEVVLDRLAHRFEHGPIDWPD